MRNSWVLILALIIAVMGSPLMADSLGQITVLHPLLGPQVVTYEAISGYAVAEGDVLLVKLSTSSAITPKATIIKLEASRWPGGVIPYELDERLPFANKQAVWDAIERWKRYTSLVFVELTDENRAQYPDYVAFIPEKGRLCASFVGRQGGRQVVQLSGRCDTMITVHEIGHALGLWHEQSRMDRDNYIRILWENIEERSRFNFEQHLSDGVDFGTYDYHSVMHYSGYAFSKNGEPTIIPLKEGGGVIGQREALSERDIEAVNAMYPGLRYQQE